MKAKIASAIISIALFAPIMAINAQSVSSVQTYPAVDGWETTIGHQIFTSLDDKLIVEMNGSQILSVGPEWQINGEVPMLILEKSYAFQVNANVSPRNIKIYLQTNNGTIVVK